MNDEVALATLRSAERAILAAYRHMPYPSDVAEEEVAFVNSDINAVNDGLNSVRRELAKVERSLLTKIEQGQVA